MLATRKRAHLGQDTRAHSQCVPPVQDDRDPQRGARSRMRRPSRHIWREILIGVRVTSQQVSVPLGLVLSLPLSGRGLVEPVLVLCFVKLRETYDPRPLSAAVPEPNGPESTLHSDWRNVGRRQAALSTSLHVQGRHYHGLGWKTLCRIKKEAKSSGFTGYVTQDPSHAFLFYTQNNRGMHAPACSQRNKTQKGHGTSKCHTTQMVLGRGRSANVSLRSFGSGLQ